MVVFQDNSPPSRREYAVMERQYVNRYDLQQGLNALAQDGHRVVTVHVDSGRWPRNVIIITDYPT